MSSNKSPYEKYMQKAQEEKNPNKGKSKPDNYAFQYIFSFLIPLIGFILGAILLSKDDKKERSAGKACIILGILSVVISGIIVALAFR